MLVCIFVKKIFTCDPMNINRQSADWATWTTSKNSVRIFNNKKTAYSRYAISNKHINAPAAWRICNRHILIFDSVKTKFESTTRKCHTLNVLSWENVQRGLNVYKIMKTGLCLLARRQYNQIYGVYCSWCWRWPVWRIALAINLKNRLWVARVVLIFLLAA